MTKTDVAEFLGCSLRTIERYVKEGRLSRKGKGKGAKYKKSEVLKIATEVQLNKERHRPDTVNQSSTIVVPDPKAARAAIVSNDVELLLNETGRDVLMQTTTLLKDNSLLDGIDKSTVMRYAIAVQLKEKYIAAAMVENDKYFFDIAKQFQAEIQHYEKELGLTPAALAKIKPLETEAPKDIDPMAEFL